jgi:hypothetical protein
MTVRPIFVALTLTAVALGAALGGCASMPAGPAPAPVAQVSPDNPVGHSLDEVTAINGPPSQQWDLPDGRRVYQWQSSSITARVGPSRKGEVQGAASQTTCFYTLYTRKDAKGVTKVVAADEPRPGCVKLAMNGATK